MVPVLGKEGTMNAVDEEFMICKVCLENFDSVRRQPKQLPCTHIYCHRCVDNFLLKGKSKKVTCPICNQSSKCCGSSAIPTCQHSINLVNTFKHLLTRNNLKPKTCQDRHENDLDAFGVEKSKRTVVKSPNPLLHPSNKWSKVNWSDDENDVDELADVKNMTLGSPPSFDEVDLNPLIDAPKCLRNLWNQQSPEVVYSHSQHSPENVDLHLEDGCAITGNSFSMSPDSTVKSTNAFNLKNYTPIQHQPGANQSAEIDESDDLDWNYFTQNFESTPKSTMSNRSNKELNREILKTNAKDLPGLKTDDWYGEPSDLFTDIKFASPSLMRSSPTGKFVLIVDRIGKLENKVHVFDANGVKKHTFNVNLEINDACLIESEDNVAIAVASMEGVNIFESGMDDSGRLIPVGRVNFVSPFMKGFVTAQDNSLSFCLDLNCSLVLQSTNIRLDSALMDGSIFKRIIDINACHNMIGILIGDQCIMINQHGNVLQSIRLFETDSSGDKSSMQLSLTPSCRKLAVVHKDKQLAELQEIGPSSTHKVPMILPLGESGNSFKVLSGTLMGENGLLAILQTNKNFRIAKYNI